MARRLSAEPHRTATRADVLTAAREILDEEGIGSLTMANVASRVGFTTMAVYRHVRNREDMLEGVLDLVLHEIADHSDPEASWLDGVESWMREVRSHLVAHPWAATMLGTSTTSTAAWTSTVNVLRSHLARSGLSTRGRARVGVWITRVRRWASCSKRSVRPFVLAASRTTRSSTTSSPNAPLPGRAALT